MREDTRQYNKHKRSTKKWFLGSAEQKKKKKHTQQGALSTKDGDNRKVKTELADYHFNSGAQVLVW